MVRVEIKIPEFAKPPGVRLNINPFLSLLSFETDGSGKSHSEESKSKNSFPDPDSRDVGVFQLRITIALKSHQATWHGLELQNSDCVTYVHVQESC